ncbi:MAG: hypothetical protein ACO3RB_00405 [Ilumatobacteraceae bacterium]
MTSPSVGLEALRNMRTARRRNRVQEMDWFEAMYRVYLAAFFGGGVILWLSGLSADGPLSAEAISDLHRHTPHVIGLIAAAAVFLGARSGANGGPISVEAAEVTHALLAPVPHGPALRRPVVQRLRTLAFAGALVGATANQVLGRRVPDHANLALWAIYGAVAGAVIATLYVVTALFVHTLRVPRLAANGAAMGLLAWQAGVTFAGTSAPGPFDAFGSLTLWWHRVNVLDLVSVAVVVGLAVVALAFVEYLSLEALVRRSALVAQLRFAVTLQDLRTVILLRRSLSQEHMRVAPWFTVPRVVRRDIVVARGLRSLAHFPPRRLVRMASLAVVIAIALVFVHRGTTPLVVVAGFASFVLGLDIIEPLSQEIDQPDRTDSFPVERGLLHTKHLIAPAVASVLFLVVGVATAVAFEPRASTLPFAALLGASALLAGIAGAAINAVSGAPDPVGGANQGLYLPPEMSGMGTVIRNAIPPAIATVGALPVIALRESVDAPWPNTVRALGGVAIVLTLCGGWVRQRDAIKDWFRNAQRESRESLAGKGS